MRVEIVCHTNKWDERETNWVFVDGKQVVRIGQGEPEDMCIGRDLPSGETLADLIKLGWDAKGIGEGFEMTVIELPDNYDGDPEDYIFGGALYKPPVDEVTAKEAG